MRSPCYAHQSASPAGLGRPRGPRRADPGPAQMAASAPAGHAGHRSSLAPPHGHPEVDLRLILAKYETHYNGQRPHRSRQLHPPRPDYPVADLAQEQIKRRPVLGGLIHEYDPGRVDAQVRAGGRVPEPHRPGTHETPPLRQRAEQVIKKPGRIPSSGPSAAGHGRRRVITHPRALSRHYPWIPHTQTRS